MNLRTVASACLAFALISSAIAKAEAPGKGPWHAKGKQLLDADNRPVKMTGVSWFGFETNTFVPHGLWARNYREMLDQIKSLGFNTVRLPFSNEMLAAGSVPKGIDFSRNPDLEGLDAIGILDCFVAHAGKIGLKLLLDRHRPDASGQSALWYTPAVPESRWVADWKMLATRYKGDPAVIGADLHNEPRSPACWGCGDENLDWRLAAQRAGNAILSVNPDWLIVVEGVETYNDSSYWWGGNLKGVESAPVTLQVANRLVYSTRDYPRSLYAQSWFAAPSYPANLPGVWDSYWGFLAKKGTTPLLMGEFGSKLDTKADQQWLETLVSYLGAGVEGTSWLFWSWNPNSQDTGGLLGDDWTTIDERKLKQLKPILDNSVLAQM